MTVRQPSSSARAWPGSAGGGLAEWSHRMEWSWPTACPLSLRGVGVRASSMTLTVPGYGTLLRTRRVQSRPWRGERQPHASGAET